MNLLEGERIDAIMNGSQFQADYTRGSVIDEVVNGFQYDPTNTWTNYTFHHDMLQSVVGLSNHDGSVLRTISYDPFGNMMTNIGVGSNNSLYFTGREQDPDSGLYYYRARYYDPTLGMFLTEDPKGFRAGANFYICAKNNPVNKNDPLGLDAEGDLALGDMMDADQISGAGSPYVNAFYNQVGKGGMIAAGISAAPLMVAAGPELAGLGAAASQVTIGGTTLGQIGAASGSAGLVNGGLTFTFDLAKGYSLQAASTEAFVNGVTTSAGVLSSGLTGPAGVGGCSHQRGAPATDDWER